ncbi:MAG: efflux RND transporter periplasmic adaptor subunit [Patescibacteria group bacterium]|nr:efflux RND transporter periplasmic adaptor subunit [Patescibacteria group bacterium]
MKLKLKKIKNIKLTKKKIIILAVLFFVLSFGFSKAKAFFRDPVDLYETETVSRKDLVQTISASGVVDAQEKATLRFQASGKLVWVGAREGDSVKKWQALASLDKRQLSLDLEKKLKDFETEFTNFDDTNKTYEDSVLDDTLRRIKKRAQNDLDKTVLDVEIANITNQLATIVSPIEGIVVDIANAIVGTNIISTTTSFTVAKPDKMKFTAEIDETDIANLFLGQKVLIALDAYPETEIKANIINIGFSSIVSSGGSIAFPIEIYLPENINQQFKIGMSGDIEIIIAEKENVIAIPFSAIKQNKNGEDIVEILSGKKIKERVIRTGIESDDNVEIISGLKDGEIIVISEIN